MRYPKITHLYKYYAFNENSLSVLINRKVWFSKPASLNDPFDLVVDMEANISSDNFDYMISSLKKKVGVSINRNLQLSQLSELEKVSPDPVARNEAWDVAIKKLRKDMMNSGVFCMSELNYSIPMWSHYADSHKGFCVEFERNPQNQLGNYDATCRVNYSATYPSANFFCDYEKENLFDGLFFTKSEDWKYEKEWRMINEEGDRVVSLPGEITGIIFGLNMPENQKKAISKIFAGINEIKLYAANKIFRQFKLEIIGDNLRD